jgi:hypothetical protein
MLGRVTAHVIAEAVVEVQTVLHNHFERGVGPDAGPHAAGALGWLIEMLTYEQRAELEALGIETVRAKLGQPGPGRGANLYGFKTGVEGGALMRGDVEDWLAEKNAEQTREHANEVRVLKATLGWAKVAGVASIVGALAAVMAIGVSVWLDRQANRPHLVPTGPDIVWSGTPVLRLQWHNTGKAVGRDGHVTVFSIRENGKKDAIASGPVVGASANILPGFGASAILKVDLSNLSEKLLLCLTFSDEEGQPFEAASLFKVPPNKAQSESVSALIEQATPDVKLCH